MTPRAQEVPAPAGWRQVDLISDLHLQPAAPATFAAFRHYLADTPANALFILGDLFEAWVGDDAISVPGFDADCAALLRATAQRIPLFFLAGNRDFLVGRGLLEPMGATLLDDPAVLTFGGHRWLLSHGDALCLDDTAYLEFRAQVRASAWQQAFLAQPLAQRQAIAQGLRQQSAAAQRAGDGVYADVDHAAALQWLQAARADTLIHGHTHRPGEHALDARHRRIVLSDWDAEAQPPRLQALRLAADGSATRIALAPCSAG